MTGPGNVARPRRRAVAELIDCPECGHEVVAPLDAFHDPGCDWASEVEDLPVRALRWARQLLETGYVDEHFVTFDTIGYGLEHPIGCRTNLRGCMLEEWLHGQMAPDRDPGRYLMRWAEEGPTYDPVEEIR